MNRWDFVNWLRGNFVNRGGNFVNRGGNFVNRWGNFVNRWGSFVNRRGSFASCVEIGYVEIVAGFFEMLRLGELCLEDIGEGLHFQICNSLFA